MSRPTMSVACPAFHSTVSILSIRTVCLRNRRPNSSYPNWTSSDAKSCTDTSAKCRPNISPRQFVRNLRSPPCFRLCDHTSMEIRTSHMEEATSATPRMMSTTARTAKTTTIRAITSRKATSVPDFGIVITLLGVMSLRASNISRLNSLGTGGSLKRSLGMACPYHPHPDKQHRDEAATQPLL